MFRCILFVIILVNEQYFFAWSFSATQKICSLNVDADLTKINQPLMVKRSGLDYSFLLPEKNERESVINLTGNDRVIMICAGESNEFTAFRKNTVVTECREDQLKLEKGYQMFKTTNQFHCSNPITPEIKKTKETCGDDSQSTIFKIGFNAKALNKWFSLLIICHNVLNMDTLYSINTIIGKSIDARQKNVPRPPEFMEGNLPELYEGSSPNKLYFKTSQIRLFQNLFKPYNVDDYVNQGNEYLSRGHLTPDADMLLSSWKVATYMFINVAPQWQSINAGNWLKVENKVRDAATWSKDDLTVVTGTYGVLKLRIGTIEKEIHLATKNKLRVPEQFWKIVYHEKSQAAIVIITSNNPYAEVKFLCNDVCQEYNWSHEQFHVISKGYTYCCTYEEFIKQVKYAPPLKVLQVYSMPKKPPLQRFRSAVKKVIKSNRQQRWNQKRGNNYV